MFGLSFPLRSPAGSVACEVQGRSACCTPYAATQISMNTAKNAMRL